MTDTKASSAPGAVARYQAAVREFRSAYAALAASDQMAGRQGFGPPPNIVELRHAIACPDLSGSLADDIAKLLR